MKVSFYLSNEKSKKSTSILVLCSVLSKKIKVQTLIKVNPKDWNTKAQRLRTRFDVDNAAGVNKYLDDLTRQVNDMRLQMVAEGSLTAERFKVNLQALVKGDSQVDPDKVTLLQYYEVVAGNRKPIRAKKIRSKANVLQEFFDYQGRSYDFRDVDQKMYYDLLKWGNEVRGWRDGTFGDHINVLQTVLNEGLELGIHTNRAHQGKKFKVITEKIDHPYLTPDELLQLLEVSGLSDMAEACRDVFYCQCKLLLRFSDSGIQAGSLFERSGTMYLRKRTSKTSTPIVIPCPPSVIRILEKYDFQPPELINQVYNRNIKAVCEKAGINSPFTYQYKKSGEHISITKPKFELITTHTARRSAATNMYMAGIPVKFIMDLGGWKKYETFMGYISITQEETAYEISGHGYFTEG